MAKNYKSIYESSNDASALEQRFYLKAETSRGEIAAPGNSDFLYVLSGSSIQFSQPTELSPHRSGRHATDIIKKKKECSFTIKKYFNIDTSLGSADDEEIDVPVKVLYESLLGAKDLTSGAKFDASVAPNVTFSLFEVSDKFSRQARGGFAMGGKLTFPGDGEATAEITGNAAEAYLVGIGKVTTSCNGGNVVAVQSGEHELFPVGSLVMIVKNDGTTRSSDTTSAPRKVTASSSSGVTLSGAALADCDGSTSPVFLCYWEPASPAGINNPQTGLQGSIDFGSLSTIVRSCAVDIQNNHEMVSYAYGSDSLSFPFFVPGSRLAVKATVEVNLNKESAKLFNKVQKFEAQAITVKLGDDTGRHLQVEMPKVLFSVPSFDVPDTGSIPVSFEGNALQSALDAADELTVHFK
ncbi:hypothetical protein EBX31_06440 [bacterium]|nr:hypothetical protein [bacterium]